MPSTSTPNLGTYEEKKGPFHGTIRPTLPSESKSQFKTTSPSKSSTSIPPPLTFTHTSPPYDPLFPPTPFYDLITSPSKRHLPLSIARLSLPTTSRSNLLRTQTSPSTLTSTQPRAYSYPLRKTSPPTFRPRFYLHRLRSSMSVLGKVFVGQKEEESDGESGEEEATSVHLELPPDVSRDKSEIEYLRRMEREVMSSNSRLEIQV